MNPMNNQKHGDLHYEVFEKAVFYYQVDLPSEKKLL
jgi:hypothetical protein